MAQTPEQRARREIDADLTAAGWLVQDREELDLTVSRGIAVREFTMKPGFGFADYLLYVDRKAIGAVEAKAGGTLTGVEAQSAKYAGGLPDNLPAHKRPYPFCSSPTARCTSSQMVSTPFRAAGRSSTSLGLKHWPSGWRSQSSFARV